FGKDEAALLGLRFEDLEDQLLFAHPRGACDVQLLGDLGELLNAHVLQLADVEPFPTTLPLTLALLRRPLLRWSRRRGGWCRRCLLGLLGLRCLSRYRCGCGLRRRRG